MTGITTARLHACMHACTATNAAEYYYIDDYWIFPRVSCSYEARPIAAVAVVVVDPQVGKESSRPVRQKEPR